VVIPTYNESENIVPLIRSIAANLGTLPRIVVVDDSGNTDTVDAIVGAGMGPEVTIIKRNAKLGRGSAVLEGMRELLQEGSQYLVEMDGDYSHAPEEITGHLEHAITVNADILVASRYLPDSRIVGWPVTRAVFSRCANLLAGSLLSLSVTDYTNGYRVHSERAARLAVNNCGIAGGGFISLSEVLVRNYCAGYRLAERPSIFVNRTRGESAFSCTEIMQAFIGILKVWRLKHRLSRTTNRSRKIGND
jgi:dolichol-phosphate mannosyltransferase